jgi:TldD protein
MNAVQVSDNMVTLAELVPPELATRVLAHALRRHGDYAELYAEHRQSEGISADDGRIDRVTTGVQRGLSVRVASGGTSALAFTESLDEASLLAVAEAASDATNGAPAESIVRVKLTPFAARPLGVARWSLPGPDRVALVESGDRAARAADPRICQATVFLGTITQDVIMATSDGRYVADTRHRLRYRVQAVARASAGGRTGTGTYAPGVSEGFEFLERCTPEAIARRAANQALAQLEAGPAPAGRMPVVLGNEAGGVLVHEACGHGLEADAVLRGGSVYAGRVGELVGSAGVNVIDDGLLPGGWGSSRFDDEAEATGRTVLIEAGVLAGFLSDRASAAALGVSATGNGRRASFRHLPLPRMTNTYIDNGEATPEEIIGNTRYGLYAPSLSGGQVDPTSGSFLFAAREAYLIREGRIDRPVWGATIAGSALDVLADIDMVGNDLRVGAGNCAREGQRVFVGIGQPTVRIARMVVGGTDRRTAPSSTHETG